MERIAIWPKTQAIHVDDYTHLYFWQKKWLCLVEDMLASTNWLQFGILDVCHFFFYYQSDELEPAVCQCVFDCDTYTFP